MARGEALLKDSILQKLCQIRKMVADFRCTEAAGVVSYAFINVKGPIFHRNYQQVGDL